MNSYGDYKIERLNHQNVNDLTILSKAIYGKILSKQFFEKKYNSPFLDLSYLGFFAYHDSQPVAFFGVIPCFIKHEDKIINAAQAVDAMTLLTHRKRKLFVVLVSAITDLCKNNSISLLFGFPNQNSTYALQHVLHWQQIGIIERFTIPVKTFPLEKMAIKFKRLDFLYKKYIPLILKRNNITNVAFANSLLAEGFASVYHDEKFFNYKKNNYNYIILINKTKVWFRINNGLIVGDMSGIENDFDDILKALIRICKYLGINKLQFQVNDDTKLFSLLSQKIMPEQSFPILIKNIDDNLFVDNLKFTFSDIDIF